MMWFHVKSHEFDRTKTQDGRRECAVECDRGGPSVTKVFFMDEVMVWRRRKSSCCRDFLRLCHVETGMFSHVEPCNATVYNTSTKFPVFAHSHFMRAVARIKVTSNHQLPCLALFGFICPNLCHCPVNNECQEQPQLQHWWQRQSYLQCPLCHWQTFYPSSPFCWWAAIIKVSLWEPSWQEGHLHHCQGSPKQDRRLPCGRSDRRPTLPWILRRLCPHCIVSMATASGFHSWRCHVGPPSLGLILHESIPQGRHSLRHCRWKRGSHWPQNSPQVRLANHSGIGRFGAKCGKWKFNSTSISSVLSPFFRSFSTTGTKVTTTTIACWVLTGRTLLARSMGSLFTPTSSIGPGSGMKWPSQFWVEKFAGSAGHIFQEGSTTSQSSGTRWWCSWMSSSA